MTGSFKDHFSTQSDVYAKYRPTYPPALFQFLATQVAAQDTAWDCATGNGQAARALAEHFSKVIATDASPAQIDAAIPHPRVKYTAATAERSGLDDCSVDLIAVAQAFHWFDEQQFVTEACRVLRRNGVLAIWCYELCAVDQRCDAIIDRLYSDIVGEFWPVERAIIEQGYSEIKIPGIAIATPDLAMTADWRVADMLGYLRTWSACEHFKAAHGRDPVDAVEAELKTAWGGQQRPVTWPLTIKAYRMNTLLE